MLSRVGKADSPVSTRLPRFQSPRWRTHGARSTCSSLIVIDPSRQAAR
jgi:hypothetical protein